MCLCGESVGGAGAADIVSICINFTDFSFVIIYYDSLHPRRNDVKSCKVMSSQKTHPQSSNIHPLTHILDTCALIFSSCALLQFTPTTSYNGIPPLSGWGEASNTWPCANMLRNMNKCENGWSNFSASFRVGALELTELIRFALLDQLFSSISYVPLHSEWRHHELSFSLRWACVYFL